MANIIIKNKQQIVNIKEAGKYLNDILRLSYHASKPGTALIELERLVQDYINKNGKIKGSFKGYRGYPANLCLSVNDCVVHGIPNDYILKNGDLLKIDCGVTFNGCISDAAVALVVGGELANPIGFDLVKSTKNALDYCLQFVSPGKKIYEYSDNMQKFMKARGFNVLHNLTGHGVGVALHEAPYIYNYPHPDTQKYSFKPGMVVALEPITSISSISTIEKGGNKRNLYTKLGDLGSQWEYTVAITDNGYEILAGVTQI